MSSKSREELLEDARRARLADEWWRGEMRRAVREECIDELYERVRPFFGEIANWKERGDEESSYERSCFVCLNIFLLED